MNFYLHSQISQKQNVLKQSQLLKLGVVFGNTKKIVKIKIYAIHSFGIQTILYQVCYVDDTIQKPNTNFWTVYLVLKSRTTM